MQEFSIHKLFNYPQKTQSLLRMLKGEMDTDYPISVEFSLTNECNFGCIWCSDALLRKNHRGSMRREVIYSTISDLAKGGTKGIVLEGGGEPVLHPLFKETIQFIKKNQMAAGLITNGSIFDYKEYVQDFEWIRVSLDVSNEEQMDSLKRKNYFSIVMKNIEDIGVACAQSNQTILGISYIVTNKNTEGLEEMVVRLKNLNASYIQIKPVVDHKELSLPEEKYDFLYLKKYETEDFKVYLEPLKENILENNNNLPCVAHSLSTVIAANGHVYLCGRLNADPLWPPIGNVNDESFYDIWNGPKRREQMLQMLNVEECKKRCPSCRMTKFNLALDHIRSNQLNLKKIHTKTPNFI